MGEYVMCPSWDELIKRNLSRLRCVILSLKGETTTIRRRFYEEEARKLIRLHNSMMQQNRTTVMRSR